MRRLLLLALLLTPSAQAGMVRPSNNLMHWTWPSTMAGTQFPCHLDSAIVTAFLCCDQGPRTIMYRMNPAGQEGRRDTIQLPEDGELRWWEVRTHSGGGWSEYSNMVAVDVRPYQLTLDGSRVYCPTECPALLIKKPGLFERLFGWLR